MVTAADGTALPPLLKTGTVTLLARPASRLLGCTKPGETSVELAPRLSTSSVIAALLALSSDVSRPSASDGRTLVNAQPVGACVQFDHVSPARLVSNTSSGFENDTVPSQAEHAPK